jgi:cytochrome b pre-mRNA-processing protein 3
MLARFFKKIPSYEKKQAISLYEWAVEKSRSPFFYLSLDIPDTPEGRFEILTIHLFLILHKLKKENHKDTSTISQYICDMVVADLDHCLRDLRLSDLKISQSFKKMIQGFYGRLVSYDDALGCENIPFAVEDLARKKFVSSRSVHKVHEDCEQISDNAQSFKSERYKLLESIQRNVYGLSLTKDHESSKKLVNYVIEMNSAFNKATIDQIIKGDKNHAL